MLQNEPMLTVKQIANLLNIDEKTVRRWIQRGELIALNIGGARPEYRVNKSSLNDFVEHRQTGKKKDE